MAKQKSNPAEDALEKLGLNEEQKAKVRSVVGLVASSAVLGGGKQPLVPAKDGSRGRVTKAIKSIRYARTLVERVQRDTHFLYHADAELKTLKANEAIEAALQNLHPCNLPYVLAMVADRMEEQLERATKINAVDARRMWIAKLCGLIEEMKGKPHGKEVATLVNWATGWEWDADDVAKCRRQRSPLKRNRKLPPRK